MYTLYAIYFLEKVLFKKKKIKLWHAHEVQQVHHSIECLQNKFSKIGLLQLVIYSLKQSTQCTASTFFKRAPIKMTV